MHQEFTVCQEKLEHGSGQRCNMVFFREETLNDHVGAAHDVKDLKLAEKALVRGRSGLDSKVEYACSSCSQPIQTLKPSPALSTDRRDVYVADHVCAHTMPQTTSGSPSTGAPTRDPESNHHRRSSTRVNKRRRDSDRDGTTSVRKRARGELIWYCVSNPASVFRPHPGACHDDSPRQDRSCPTLADDQVSAQCRCQEMASMANTPLCMGCSHQQCSACRIEECPPGERRSGLHPAIDSHG